MKIILILILFFLLLLNLINSTELMIKLYQDKINIFGGHSKECFSFALINFESCKQIFLISKCSYLKYENKICSLHDHTLQDFKQYSYVTETIILTILNNTTAIYIPNLSIPATLKYEKCLNQQQNIINKDSFHLLPKLGIVISVTSEWVKLHENGVKSLQSNFMCYAKVHNYSFYLNIMPNMSPAKFYFQRHRSILHNYLPYHQYILHLDADSLILNHSRSLEPYLSNSNVDIHLHLHENSEVTAAIYLLKNSKYSYCFLEYWSNFSPMHSDIIQDIHSLESYNDLYHNNYKLKSLNSLYLEFLYTNTYEVPNYDNGDLVSGLYNLLYPKKYFQCLHVITSFDNNTWLSFTNSYHQTIVECWKLTHHNLYRHIYKHIIPKRKIQIYYPHEGFWRTKGKMNRFDKWWDDLFGVCFPSIDIIGHGWKAMAKTLWPLPENGISHKFQIYQDMNITRLYLKNKVIDSSIIDKSICRINEIKKGFGANPYCKWITETEELEISQKYCLWKSNICKINHINSLTSLCQNSTKCFQKCLNNKNSTCGNGSLLNINKTRKLLNNEEKDKNLKSKLSILLLQQLTKKNGVEYEDWWKQQLCATCPINIV